MAHHYRELFFPFILRIVRSGAQGNTRPIQAAVSGYDPVTFFDVASKGLVTTALNEINH